ncbi:type II toxin-antitoxin system RelE family toxin [Rickettsia bellii]|uniref:Uncharacterized protein n=2 Tax=Rickettsia bellii TaxID=33990 RepID=Q1RGN8_RICBR|nr:hypothetical protein [Rickettsia bellii]ABE05476.1 unknown [Rickettsia bellii RML369-C]ABV79850.1 hypothetical protein A1I_07760 [Rickettsia bellii OSU 85-389]KJV92573.1 hypothetical protein RBEMOGI_1207 [Rickettsia bellii str. RML Mogi]
MSKISTNKRKTILEKLEQLRLDSYRENNNIKKLAEYDEYRLRVGDYRIIYKLLRPVPLSPVPEKAWAGEEVRPLKASPIPPAQAYL